MITALDQIRLQTPDVTSAARVLERLLARTVVAGEENAAVRLDNIALEIAWAEGGSEGFTQQPLAFDRTRAEHAAWSGSTFKSAPGLFVRLCQFRDPLRQI